MPPIDIRQMCRISRANDLNMMETQVGDYLVTWIRTGLCKQRTRARNVEGCGAERWRPRPGPRFGPVDSARLDRTLWD
jgi:hypothetical protein